MTARQSGGSGRVAGAAPSFWWQEKSWQARALSPLAAIYGAVAGKRMRRTRRAEIALPVLCIGNFTTGGAGKTPTALALADIAKAMGLTPGFLTRGYGGRLSRTTIVDPARHGADEVGDEPLLLARAALTVISRGRVDGARRLVEAGVDIILMDDGFQSARLAIDFALVVVDGRRGIGNGRVLPAGPLRAPLAVQMQAASALLRVGDGRDADPVVRQAARAGKPVWLARLAPRPDDAIAGKRLLAFAGIADPEKFHRTLRELGGEIAATRAFADHHAFSEEEAGALLQAARRDGLMLVTTAKDAVRLSGRHGALAELAAAVKVVEVDMVFDDPRQPRAAIEAAMAAFRQRMLAG